MEIQVQGSDASVPAALELTRALMAVSDPKHWAEIVAMANAFRDIHARREDGSIQLPLRR